MAEKLPIALPLPSHFDRRSVRHAQARRSAVQRNHALRAQFALFRLQGRFRSSGAGLFSHLRPAGGHHQLLQQLRPISARRKFIPTVIRSCLLQQPIPVYGDGSNIRDWLYVEDHCRGIDAVIRKAIGRDLQHRRLQRMGESQHRQADLRAAGRTPPAHAPHERLITFVTDRPGHDWRYAIDPRKMEREALELAAGRKLFKTGIAKTVDWYLERHATDPAWGGMTGE
jgi:hypothetical protein